MAQPEALTYALYDISHDRTRTKVSEACLNFGLTRFQFSAFQGLLTRNRREELAHIVTRLMARHGGKVAIFPVGSGATKERIDVEIEATPHDMVLVPRLTVFAPDPTEEDRVPSDQNGDAVSTVHQDDV